MIPIKYCQRCKVVPAGTSKRTGKPYDSFAVCDNEDCPNYKPKQEAKTGKTYQAPVLKPLSGDDKILTPLRELCFKADSIEKALDDIGSAVGRIEDRINDISSKQ